jgi:ABC-2 type transport system permease protein
VIDNLAPAFRAVSYANPFFYVISGFRFGFLGASDIGDTNADVINAAIGLGALNLVLLAVTYALLRSGWRIRN